MSQFLSLKPKLALLLGHFNQEDLIFPFKMWLLSRALVAIAMLLVAPLLAAPGGGIQAQFGWDVFSAWDSNFYVKMAASGYEILPNHEPGANVAFFPLFAIAIYLLGKLGMTTIAAGTVLNHLAFLGTLLLLYRWVAAHNGSAAAKWVTAVVAWCPLSLFGSVVYSEGLFLLFSTAALSAFDRRSFAQAALWGSFATATRVTGLALVPAFLLTAYRRKLPIAAYIASLGAAIGVILYSVYCWLQFGDAIAFISVQYSQWNRSRGFDWTGWLRMGVEIVAGGSNWNAGGLKDLTHPLIFGLIVVLGLGLWKFRAKIDPKWLDYGFFLLFLLLWLLAGDPLLNTLSVLGGVYLVWKLRKDLSLVAVNYGLFGLGMLIASGGTISLNRLVYGIVPVSMALGVLLSRHRRWGYCVMGFFGLLLVLFSIRFAQHLWVA